MQKFLWLPAGCLNIRSLVLVIGACVPLVVGGCAKTAVYRRAPAKPVPRWTLHAVPRVPESLGVQIHFTDPRAPDGLPPGEMRMIAAAGFHWIRQDIGWNITEPVKGHYDFRIYDHLLTVLHRYHIRAILTFDYGNPLYDHGRTPATRQARRAFVRWTVAAVRHFRGRGIIWEMWNEPNTDSYFRLRPSSYAELAVEVGRAIRRVAPGELYVGPALANLAKVDRGFLRACLKTTSVLQYWNAVSIHPYRVSIPEDNIAGSMSYPKIRTLIAQYAPKGKNIPIISSEWGYTTTWHDPGKPSLYFGQFTAVYTPTWHKQSEAWQASMVAREFLVNLSQGIPLSIWYDFHDDGTDPNSREDHFGLVHFTYHRNRNPVFTPKPAYLAAKTLMTQLRGCRFVKRMKIGAADDYVLLFAEHNNERIAAWTTSYTMHEVLLPIPSGSYRLTNDTGTKTRMLAVRGNKLRLAVSHDPEYLVRQ